MRTNEAVAALAALAQESRLQVWSLLVRHGEAGLLAGEIAQALGALPSTLSFHLRDLCAAGLLQAHRSGRSIRYSVVPEVWRQLLWHLGEDCCQGREALCTSPSARIDALQTGAVPGPSRPRVLFLCSQNSARSQLAEALLRHHAGDRFVVSSAGVRPARLHPLTRTVLAEEGISTQGMRSKDLGELLGKQGFDHAFVVCPDAQVDCPNLPRLAPDQQFWPFPDPAAVMGTKAQRLQAFREVRSAIDARLRLWLRTDLRSEPCSLEPLPAKSPK